MNTHAQMKAQDFLVTHGSLLNTTDLSSGGWVENTDLYLPSDVKLFGKGPLKTRRVGSKVEISWLGIEPFSFQVTDSSTEVTRDFLGHVPISYGEHRAVGAWGSDPAGVLKALGLPTEINRSRLLRFVMGSDDAGDDEFVRHVRRLRPGQRLETHHTASGVGVSAHDRAPNVVESGGQPMEFIESRVRRLTPTPGVPAQILLSSGLDSNYLLHLMNESAFQKAITFVAPEFGIDESLLLREIDLPISHETRHLRVPAPGTAWERLVEETLAGGLTPSYHPEVLYLLEIWSQLDDGAPVVSGIGGDQISAGWTSRGRLKRITDTARAALAVARNTPANRPWLSGQMGSLLRQPLPRFEVKGWRWELMMRHLWRLRRMVDLRVPYLDSRIWELRDVQRGVGRQVIRDRLRELGAPRAIWGAPKRGTYDRLVAELLSDSSWAQAAESFRFGDSDALVDVISHPEKAGKELAPLWRAFAASAFVESMVVSRT